MSEESCARSVRALVLASRRAVTMALLLGVAACGGGGGGDAPQGGQGTAPPPAPAPVPLATAASQLFPLDSNGVAVFSSSAGAESVVFRVAGTQQQADKQTATLVRQQDPNATTDSYRGFVQSELGLRQYAAVGADALQRAFDGSYVMRWPAYAGDSFVQLDATVDSGLDFDGDGRADPVALRADVSVLGLETVATPAGTFSNTLHQRQLLKRTVRPSSGKAEQQLTTTTDTWYAPGVGIVRQVQSEQGPGAGAPVTLSLSKYRFGALSNDSDAPALLSVQPALGSPAPANAKVTALFSEEIDEGSVTPQSFVLTDPAGQPVSGALRVSGRTISYTPTQALSEGTHRVNLGVALQDLFGRGMAAQAQRSFTVDTSAPRVLSTWPAADARNVALSTSISVGFSKAPSSASVNATTVQLLLDGAPVPATARASSTYIAIEPVANLLRGRRYEVMVNGVTDQAGNPLGQTLRFGFDTTPGRFAAPERVAAVGTGAIGASSLAAGDVNGDGIPDIVYADLGDDNDPDAIYFRAGRADGQLDPPLRLNLAAYFQPSSTRRCPITALAIGDLNGDGRADVAVGSWNCGVLLLRQTPAGALEPGQFLDQLIQVLRIADLNGDGRLDLVGVQNFWNKAFVWLQASDGQLNLNQMPGLGDVAGRDVAIGDLNGDGRPDLIVALRAADTGSANIALLMQQPDGQFAAARTLSTGLIHGIWGVAVGDFNSDGRLDIAGTTNANSPTSLLVFLQAADGNFPAPMALPTLDGAYSVLAGDLNGDGRMDLVVNHEGWSMVGLYLQGAAGTLAPEELYEAPGRSVNVQVLAISDINRDGLLDVIGPASLLRQVPLAARSPAGAAPHSAGQAASGSGRR